MKAFTAGALRCLCAAALTFVAVQIAAAQTPTFHVVAAANKFIATLDQKQRLQVLFAFDDETQRARWSNLPISSVRRAGLSMGELNQAQRSAAMALLAAVLSNKGFEKVHQIMEADELLRQSAGKPVFGRDLYYISFLGAPSGRTTWMLQFGGHHLALNITVQGERGVLTPSLIGDLSLTADGIRRPLRLVSSVLAPKEALQEGRGEIQLRLEADVPAGAARRRLTLENRHQRGIGVYLVNALLPRDPDIQLAAQRRSQDQTIYELDYTDASVPAGVSSFAARPGAWGWIGGALTGTLIVGLALVRRRLA